MFEKLCYISSGNVCIFRVDARHFLASFKCGKIGSSVCCHFVSGFVSESHNIMKMSLLAEDWLPARLVGQKESRLKSLNFVCSSPRRVGKLVSLSNKRELISGNIHNFKPWNIQARHIKLLKILKQFEIGIFPPRNIPL